MTVREWFEEVWPRSVRGLGRGTSRETIKHTLEMARPFVRRFGGLELATLCEHVVECSVWAQAHPTNVRYARTVVADAVLLGKLPASPLGEVRVKHGPGTGRGEFFPTLEEVNALADAGEKWGLREWVLTGAWSGARLTAMALLDVPDVTASNGLLRLQLRRKRRSGKYPAVLLQPGADALAAVLPARGAVFRRPKGGRWDRHSISERWVKMRREVGLPEACTSHCLRRFYATKLLDMGVSYSDAAMALDHLDKRGRPNIELVQRVYGKPSPEEALERIEGLAA
jgi:integrase